MLVGVERGLEVAPRSDGHRQARCIRGKPRRSHDLGLMLVPVGTQLPAEVLHDKDVHAQIDGRAIGQFGVDFVSCRIHLPDPDDLRNFQNCLCFGSLRDWSRRRPDGLWIGNLGKRQRCWEQHGGGKQCGFQFDLPEAARL
jgi:hypothetical protein